ncbi:MAG: SpaA isopeptide-forming pilin-related protein [Peptostreptococcaceae bacterium]|nr:SpaA isopeptide-forming pilin-related protein [Peptostreptococcaceae bacterium]
MPEKNHRIQKQILSYLLTMMLVLNIFLPSGAHAQGTEYDHDQATARMTVSKTQLFVDAKEVSDGEEIIADKDIKFDLAFQLDLKTAPALTTNDTLTFTVMKGFNLLNTLTREIYAKADEDDASTGTKIGSLEMRNNGQDIIATITFDKGPEASAALDSADHIDIVMGASMHYAGVAWQVDQNGEAKNFWGKSFRLMPSDPDIQYKLTKSGKLLENDISKPKIEWTVKVSATGAGKPFSLRGHYLKDDLTEVGKYVPESFKIDGVAVADQPVVKNDNILTYPFTDDLTKEKTITFETEVLPKHLFTAPSGDLWLSTSSVDNRIDLYRENNAVSRVHSTANVSFKSQWIKKGGSIKSIQSAVGTDREITWEIIINNFNVKTDSQDKKILSTPKGMTLTNVVITDPLKNGQLYDEKTKRLLGETAPEPSAQTFKEAYLQEYDGNGKWKTQRIKQWGKNQAPQDGSYEIGTITGPVKLTIITTIPGSKLTQDTNDISVVRYLNDAKVRWDGSGEIPSETVFADFRFNSIKESFSKYHYPKADPEWEITVEERTNAIDDLKFFNMVTFGDDPITNISSLTAKKDDRPVALPEGFVNAYTGDGTGKLQGLGQRFLKDTFLRTTPGAPGNDPTHEILDLYDRDKMVGELLVVKGITGTHRETFKIRTELVSKKLQDNLSITSSTSDPDANNITNSSTLLTGATKLDYSTARAERRIRMLYKDHISRDFINGFESNANKGYTEDASLGFDYTNKEVIYRLSINPLGYDHTTREYFDLDTKTMKKHGPVTITDTLPPGWELKNFDTGSPFMLFRSGKISDSDGDARVTLTDDQGRTLSVTSPVQDPLNVPEGMGLSVKHGTVEVSGVTRNTIEFKFDRLDRAAVIFIKAGPTATEREKLFSKNGETTVVNSLTYKADSGLRFSASRQDTFSSKAIEKKLKMKNEKEAAIDANGAVTWVLDYYSYNLPKGTRANIKVVDTLPAGLELPMDAEGKLLYDEAIKIYEIPFTNGSYPSIDTDISGPDLAGDLRGNISYDLAKNKLTFTVPLPGNDPDPVKSYRIEYKTYIVDPPAKTADGFTNTAQIFSGDTALKDSAVSSKLQWQDGYVRAILGQNAFIEIIKQDAARPGTKLADARFALYPVRSGKVSKDPLRAGSTDSNGVVTLNALRVGSYKLKEVHPPNGYLSSDLDIDVVVTTQTGKKVVTVTDNKAAEGSGIVIDSNTITIPNKRESKAPPILNNGTLKVKKILSGVPADPSKTFGFTFETPANNDPAAQKASYSYTIYKNDVAGTPQQIGSGGSFSLGHDEYALIEGLPHGAEVTITENAAGYRTTVVTKDAQGTLSQPVEGKTASLTAKDNTALEMTFTNTPSGGGNGGGGNSGGGGGNRGDHPSPVRPDSPKDPQRPQSPDKPKDPERPQDPDRSKTPEQPKTPDDPIKPEAPKVPDPQQPSALPRTNDPSNGRSHTRPSGPNSEDILDDDSAKAGLDKQRKNKDMNKPSKVAGAPKTGIIGSGKTIRNFLTYGTILMLSILIADEYRRRK